MVRPVISCNIDIQGTISDRLLLICRGSSGSFWAMIVFLRISQQLHAAMIPVSDQANAIATFMEFLKNENDSIEVNICHFLQSQGQWEINKNSIRLVWPKKGILYPEGDSI